MPRWLLLELVAPTVITVDIRGTGESEFLTDMGDYAIEKVYADLNAVADACEVRQFAVWGFSLGGNIARYLGAWSDRVTAIAVIGVPFGPAVDEEFDRYIDEFPPVQLGDEQPSWKLRSHFKLEQNLQS